MKKSVPKFVKKSLGKIARLPSPIPIRPIEKIDESLTPNMRALRLTMNISEQLLSMGVAASDVVHMAQGITQTYCKRPVHLDVSYTQITISQDRGIDREPLTLIRTIVPDDANYQLIQSLQSLALSIRDTHLPLAEAEQAMEDILKKPGHHNRWVICAAGGGVSAGVVILYDGSILMTALAFIMGFLATGMLRWLARLGMATAYSQVLTALVITLTASMVVWANTVFQLNINPTLLVISGIVLLVAGMMIVGAFQDAIDEYYITANARLLKVTVATSGIVVGVLIGLYIAKKFGISFPTTPDRLSLADVPTQYLGALLIAATFALRNHAKFFGILIAGCVGALGWWLMRLLETWDLGVVIASGVAAAVIGLIAIFVSRAWRIPSLAIIAAGIVPLVPGLSLYNGLMGVVQYPPGDPGFMMALAVLMRAVMIGVAVAAGASLGNMIGRPVRRYIRRTYRKIAA